jgi:MFS family permease
MSEGVVFVCFFFYAVAYNMFGPLATEIMQTNTMTLDSAGALLSTVQIGAVLAIVSSFFLIRKKNPGLLFRTGVFIVSASLFLLLFFPKTPILFLLFAVFGFGGFFLDSGANAYLSESFAEKRKKYIPLLHFCYSLGALSSGYIMLPFKNDHWNMGYAACGILLATMLFLGILGASRKKTTGNTSKPVVPLVKQNISSLTILKDKTFLLYCFVLMLYMTSQQICSNWFPKYCEDTFATAPTLVAMTTFCFWSGIAVMRLSSSFILSRTSLKPLVLSGWGMGLSGVFQVIALVTGNPILTYFSIAACGFFAGATIPCFILEVTSWYPGNIGFISIFYLFCGSVGRIFIPYLIAVISALTTLKSGLLYATALLFVASFLSLIVYRKVYPRQ